jgi:hypothetical protein
VSACSSAPPAPPRDAAAAGTAVTIVGWSLRDQAPIAVRGEVREGQRTILSFDTQDAAAGKTFTIAPGSYQVEVSRLYQKDRLVPAMGIQRFDVRPGETVRCEVIVEEQDESVSSASRPEAAR